MPDPDGGTPATGGAGEAGAGGAAAAAGGAPGATSGGGDGAAAEGGYRAWLETVPEEFRRSGSGFGDAMDRRDAKITSLEKETADFRGRPEPYAELLARGHRAFPDDTPEKHKAILKEMGSWEYQKLVQDEEKTRGESRKAQGSDEEQPAWAKSMREEWAALQKGQKDRTATYSEIEAFNNALDKHGITDPDERERVWKRAWGERGFAEKHGDRKLTEEEAVEAVVTARTKGEEAQKAKWQKELEEKAKGQQATLPTVGASKESPAPEGEGEKEAADSEEASFMKEFVAKGSAP